MSDEFDIAAYRANLEKISRRQHDLSEAGKAVANNLKFNLPHYEATLKSDMPGLESLKQKMRELMTAEMAFIDADLARKR